MIPLQHPEIFDAAVKACLEPDRKRLRELVEKLEHYLDVDEDGPEPIPPLAPDSRLVR